MPKRYSSKYIISILLKKGFLFVSQKGSHAKYRKEEKPALTVIVPIKRRVIPAGTFKSILRQSDLTGKDFEKK